MQNAGAQLSPTDERALIKSARGGDVGARNRLMECYYEAAKASCRRHARAKGLDQDDADSEVFFAIAEAIQGYDLRRRVPFRAYLDQRARGAVTWADREIQKQDLRTLGKHWRKRFGGSGPPGEGKEPVALEKLHQKPKSVNVRLESSSLGDVATPLGDGCIHAHGGMIASLPKGSGRIAFPCLRPRLPER